MPSADTVFEEVPNSKRGVALAGSRQLNVNQEILEVAKHLFARYGYEGTSLAAIAHGAGINLEELSDHFSDKP
ncbi:MAG TPA: helix-turn-helix domain-containing protein, partial [Gammaproteobacteria bacterium]|nr:helix-turn-helix domain-containing protein [Gammaproteobacteria bacterium]